MAATVDLPMPMEPVSPSRVVERDMTTRARRGARATTRRRARGFERRASSTSRARAIDRSNRRACAERGAL